MDDDSVAYVDPQGFRTQDYTMDASDVARLGLVSSGVSRSGAPIVNTSNDSWTRHFLGGAPDAVDAANWAAVGMGPGGVGAPTNYVTSQPRSSVGSLATSGIPNFLSQSGAGAPPMPGGAWPLVQQASVDKDNAAGMANIVQDYSTPEATAKTRAALASYIPQGKDLYDHLVATGGIDNTTTPDSKLLSGLTDPDGKALPGNQLNTKLLSDSRFQQLRKMDQINGTNNADRFYAAMNNGRSLKQDMDSNQALLSTQSSNKLKDANDLQKELTIATADNKDLGIHVGDFVRQKVVGGIMPGQDTVTHVPLNDYERELAGLSPDKSGKTDQFGRPVYNPTGNSYLMQATGLPSTTDLAYGHMLKDRKDKSDNAQTNTTLNALAAMGILPGNPFDTSQPSKTSSIAPRTTLSADGTISLLGDTAGTTVNNLINKATSVVTGGSYSPAPYKTQATALAQENNNRSAAATHFGTATAPVAGTELARMYALSHAKHTPIDPSVLDNENYNPNIYSGLQRIADGTR